MSYEQIREKRDELLRSVAESRRYLTEAEERAKKEGRKGLTAEEQENFKRFHTEQEQLRGAIDALLQVSESDAYLAGLNESRGLLAGRPESGNGGERQQATAEQRAAAFEAYVRSGYHELPAEQRAVMDALKFVPGGERRAMQSNNDTAGGYLIPDEFFNSIVPAKLAWGGMRRAGATVIRTSSGAPLSIPTDNDTSNSGAILNEGATVSTQDVSVGQAVLNAYMYTSKEVRVSRQLLQDSAFPIGPWLAEKLSTRIGRATNSHFTTGTGASQPYGVVTASTAGKTAASATAITFDELLDLKHSVDPDYRLSAKWMFNDNTLLAAKKLKDGEGRYLWQPGSPVSGEPATLDGDPYVINQSMSSIATGVKSVLYGDFSYYYIRDVADAVLLRLEERYAPELQVAFILFQRHDGVLVNPGVAPIKHLVQA